MGFFARWRELINAGLTPIDANADGPCQHCRKFVLASEGLIADNTLYCSSYCADQDEAHKYV